MVVLDDLEKVLLIFNLLQEFLFWPIVIGLLIFIIFLLLIWGTQPLRGRGLTKGGK